MGTYEGIGDRIKNRRKELELTQTEFLVKLGLSKDSRTMVSKWENGTTIPQTDIIPKICEVLDCDVGYLFGEFDHPKKYISDIVHETGLTPEAIFSLKGMSSYIEYDGFREAAIEEQKCELDFYSEMICSYNFSSLYRIFQKIHKLKRNINMDREYTITESEAGKIYMTGYDISESLKYYAYQELHKFVEEFFENYFLNEDD